MPYIHPFSHTFCYPLVQVTSKPSCHRARSGVHPWQVTSVSKGWHRGRDRESFMLTFTPTANLETPINLRCVSVGGSWTTWREPTQEEHANSTQNVPSQPVNSNPERSCCEVTVLIVMNTIIKQKLIEKLSLKSNQSWSILSSVCRRFQIHPLDSNWWLKENLLKSAFQIGIDTNCATEAEHTNMLEFYAFANHTHIKCQYFSFWIMHFFILHGHN